MNSKVILLIVLATGAISQGENPMSHPVSDDPVKWHASMGITSLDHGFASGQLVSSWEQALVSGNGRMGALVMGNPEDEMIILTHARLFLPINEPLPPVDTASHLKEIREMMARGTYQQAADTVVKLSHGEKWGGKRWTDPFIPACELKVKSETAGDMKNYLRGVDFPTGVAAVRWEDDRGAYLRRVFVSRADDVVVLSIKAPASGMLNCDLRLAERPGAYAIRETAIGAQDNWLTYHCDFENHWTGLLQGYDVVARVVAKHGTTKSDGTSIAIRNADEVIVLTRIVPLTDSSKSKIEDTRAKLSSIDTSYDALLKRHAAIHGELFNRVRLDLGGGADRALTSEQMIAKSHVGALLPALLEREYDACRYAIISSSGELFPNLQGIWNGTWSPPWSSDFTMNGNVQSAIAADLSANMAECLLPYFSYLESQMPQYRENARRLYGCRGIHVPSRTSSHGLNNHFDQTWPMTFWTAGAGWAAQFFYDYFLYTGDREFLRNRALPFMKEAAAFYEDFLIEGPDGKYLFSPSYSPENNPGNNNSQACINSTMDIAVAKELLRNCIAACEKLKTDGESVKRWRNMLAKMPDYQINKDGAVKEWTTPLLEDNYAHRHCSHLYALYNGLPDEIAANPTLRKAFQVATEKRMEIRRREGGGIMAFGLVQLGLAASSLRDSSMSYDVVDWLANNFWLPNMVTTHNPKSLFNTDLCGGLPAIVNKMLVDSQPGWIELLPAMPPQWPTGKIEGLRCRGGIELRSLTWSPQQITATLRSDHKQQVRIKVAGCADKLVDLEAGAAATVELARVAVAPFLR